MYVLIYAWGHSDKNRQYLLKAFDRHLYTHNSLYRFERATSDYGRNCYKALY